jgi:hypothetical protein
MDSRRGGNILTLLEFCKKFHLILIIKMVPTGGELGFLVYLENTWMFEDEAKSICLLESRMKAQVTGMDVNKALYRLCDKISGKFVVGGLCKEFVEKVEKGELSIVGTW